MKKLELFSSYNKIDDIFNIIKKIEEKNISLKKQSDKILFVITLLNKYSSEIILLSKNIINNSIPELEELLGDKILKKNKKLEVDKNNLEERIEKLEADMDYINKIFKSIPYN